jgi:Zn-dependent protease with chaperone function
MMPVLLAGYTVAVAAAGTWWLPRASWPVRLPRLGIMVWQALTFTVVASGLLAGLILAIPCLRVWADWASMTACAMSLRTQYATVGGAMTSTAGGLLTLSAAARLVWFTCSALTGARRSRARHDEVLALVGRRGPVPGMVLLEDDRPAVYCVPGRRRIVFTTGAMQRLDGHQLNAVLAHERAHLTGRHHLVIILAAALRRAFPLPFFAAAASQISCLVEMAADDAAARRAHRLTLAGALLTLAAARVPAGTLGAGGTAGAQRIQRLIDSPPPASRGRRLAISAAALIAAPAVAFSAPALALVYISHCPPAASHSHLASGAQPPVRGAAPGPAQAARG